MDVSSHQHLTSLSKIRITLEELQKDKVIATERPEAQSDTELRSRFALLEHIRDFGKGSCMSILRISLKGLCRCFDCALPIPFPWEVKLGTSLARQG